MHICRFFGRHSAAAEYEKRQYEKVEEERRRWREESGRKDAGVEELTPKDRMVSLDMYVVEFFFTAWVG